MTKEHRILVRYAETDQMGVVYHANYLIYMEEARTRFMAAAGVPYHEVENDGIALAVRRADVRYRAAAVYGDEVVVRTRVERVRGASLVFAYELYRGSDEEHLATGSVELACVDKRAGRKVCMLPERLREVLQELAADA